MLISIKIARNSAFLGSDKPRMPISVGILTFMSRKISCSVELSMKKDL